MRRKDRDESGSNMNIEGLSVMKADLEIVNTIKEMCNNKQFKDMKRLNITYNNMTRNPVDRHDV